MGMFQFAWVLWIACAQNVWAHGPTEAVFPSVSSGTAPFKSFSGTACAAPTALYTVPDGQDFIITMVGSTALGSASTVGDWDSGTQLLKDGEVVLAGTAFSRGMSVSISAGDGRLPVESGAQLAIQTTPSSGCGNYFIQGYLSEAGGPHRAYFGNSVDRTVMTVEAGKSFLVRTISLSTRASPWHCHVWVDGTRIIDGETFLVHDRGGYDGGNPSPFPMGKGRLLLTEGQVLQIGPDDPGDSTQCDYYIEGQYIAP